VVTQQISFDQLVDLVDGDSDKAKSIWETSKDVISYLKFKSALSLGVTIRLDDLPFEKAMVYSWIEESKNGRKN
jgi:hypothetical protein